MDALEPLEKSKQLLADAVFQYLGAAIIDGTLEQGERIRDAELAERLNVSRMPIREALQRLERIGLIEMMPSRYTRVTEVTDELVRASLVYAGYKCGIEIHAVLTSMTDEQVAEALRLLDAMDEAVGDVDAAIAARIAFSRYIASLVSENVYSQHLKDFDLALRRNLHHVGPVAPDAELHDNYARLREAITARDAGAAERLVRAQFGV
ncbi:GntR family transcriptional regulator [Microbacterium marinilacus]|uniref:GntR family transcriptional regulator n=1 Tax=Microbacterium marinilacus TaxID=415209 RepID=A0ABP7BCB7_9MICO|nr:GntR family transcriptional regulator [Microbacterium marinilacus]MBY0686991.1 GntR family transcriptional regulator [Microbacterium marinilacus]